jgi:O-antigen ligase
MIKAESRYIRFVETAAAFLLLLYPSLMFAVKGGMNGSFLLLLLLSAAVLVWRPRNMPAVVWNREMTHYLMAMAALPIAIFLSQSYHHHYSGHPYDAASRFLLAVPIFMLLSRIRFDVVAWVQYGFPSAAIVGCLLINEIPGSGGRFGIPTLDLIHFGDFELMLGVMSVFTINWTGRDALLLRSLKILGLLAGIYASIASGSRGGWIALPVFLIIFVYFWPCKLVIKAIVVVQLALVLTGIFAYVSSQQTHHRVGDAVSDLSALRQGNRDTSMGIRLQLFQAAAEIAKQNPIFGVGPEGFALEMEPMKKAGKITAMAAELGKGEAHNELLSKAAALGIFGLIAMLSLYLVPLRIFYRAACSDVIQVSQSGMLGLVFVSGFMIFGLTVETLNLTMAAAFYGLTVAALLAACLNIHHGEQIAVRKPE